MTDWQPIATAPKDNTSIIVTDGFKVCVGFYDVGLQVWVAACIPTHWISLPPLPR